MPRNSRRGISIDLMHGLAAGAPPGSFLSLVQRAGMPGYAILSQPWWVPVLWILVLGHVTNICITLYLHRGATHGGVRFHRGAEHFFRAWLWLTTGMNTREWVAIHRKHHAFSDRPGDPHSPAEEGFWAIVLGGVFFYKQATADKELLEKYGKGCPDDGLERNVYAPHRWAGLFLVLAVDILLFGALVGLLVWSAMAIWVPIMGNVINGIGHALGYRNFETKDESHNIYPFGFWIVGEELHNNHHADPRSATFKAHWWEFDIGWIYIRALAFLGLAEVVYARQLAPAEFAAKYYAPKEATGLTVEDTPEFAVTAEPASGMAATARRELEEAREGLRRVKAEWATEVERARIRLEELRSEASRMRAEAGAELSRLRAEAGAGLERVRADWTGEVEQARLRLEHTRERARVAVAQAQAAVEETAARLEGATLGRAGA